MAAAIVHRLDADAPDDAYGPRGRSAWMDVDWAAHQHWANVLGSPVNHVDIGEGPAIVLVHGLSGSWPNWLENIPHLARSHRVIALDLPGFGRSPMPSWPITMEAYAATVDALLDQLGIDRAILAGNSMGGQIAAELTLRRPERVPKLVLVSPAGISTMHLPYGVMMPALRRTSGRLTRSAAWVARQSEALTRRPAGRRALFGFVAAHPGRLPAPLVAEQVRGTGTPGFLDALEAMGRRPLQDRLGGIDCPVLLVWGEHDRLVPVRDADLFAAAIGTNARTIVYPDTGHVAMLERPARFNADLDAFLAER